MSRLKGKDMAKTQNKKHNKNQNKDRKSILAMVISLLTGVILAVLLFLMNGTIEQQNKQLNTLKNRVNQIEAHLKAETADVGQF